MTDVEKLRHSFKPEKITTLFVGESPPHGGTFFYKQNSVLYREMKQVFGGGDDFLEEFKANCFYLDDLVLYPINQIEDEKERDEHRRKGVRLLAARMRQYRPEAVVALMKALEPMVRSAMSEAGLSGDVPLYVVPFPAMGNARKFRNAMAEIIRMLPVCHNGQRTTDNGPRTTDNGPRTTDNGPLTTDNGPRTTDHGQRTKGFLPRLEAVIAGVRFQNPVLTASGTFGYGREFADLIDLNRLGGICVKGISADPMPGNPPPRIYETEAGMLNAIGLQNVGAKRFLTEKLPFLRTLKARCVVNVFGYSTEDYIRCIEILNAGDGIDAYELNISCPNTRCGGIVYGSDPKLTEEVVAASKRAARFPLFVKLSPNVTDIGVFARAAETGGADALTLVNTFVGMAIDVETRTPRISNVTAGLSGPAIKPLALRLVHQAAGAVSIPIIGIGGIAGAADALEFLIAGARAVQVGTANFYAPDTALRVAEGIADYLRRKRLHLDQLVGSLRMPEGASAAPAAD
ncbi:MAG TPA: dihydroorotate dehydrogenase [Terriglobia bacterium]|nr:dihydroorotate dehydrogenase [Terriglobia bacterium]